MKLVKTSFLSAIAASIKMLSGFALMKVIAVYGGPQGVAFLGQLQNFMNLILLFSGGLFKTAIIKLIAENADDKPYIHKIFVNSILISSLLVLFFSVPTITMDDEISLLLFGREVDFGFVISAFGLSIPFFVLAAIIQSVINGKQQIVYLTKLNIIASIATFLLVSTGTYAYGLNGALLFFAINQSIVVIFAVYYFLKMDVIDIKYLKISIDKGLWKKFISYGVISLFSVLSANLTIFIVRIQLIEMVGIEGAGMWQSIWAILQALLTLISMTMSVYFIPKIAKAVRVEEISKETTKVLTLILPSAIIFAVIIYLLRDVIIVLLYSREFLASEPLFLFTILALPIKAVAWVYGYILVIHQKLKSVFSSELIAAVSFCGINSIMTEIYGLVGVSYAYFYASLIHLIIVYMLSKRSQLEE